MNTALVHHPISEKHDTGSDHPETARRYLTIIETLREDEAFWNSLTEINSEKASKGLIQAAHTPQYLKRVEKAHEEGWERLDMDTTISIDSLEAAYFAAGGAVTAVKAVVEGEARNAFVAARPPGHHATSENSMGFCVFNNVAVAARFAVSNLKDVERVAIIDWDVHHGNGTQGIFYDDPNVFFFSMHQYPWYPGTGSRGETGHGRGLGKTRNLPVKANTEASEHKRMFEGAIEDIAKGFSPDLILISAGFDAHASDPLGQLMLEDKDFASMTSTVMEWADDVCDGRLVSCLEGGYNLQTLGQTVKNHVAELNR